MVPISAVLRSTDEALRRGESPTAFVWRTGFPALDDVLGGGLRAGELTLLGGPQGSGKTTFALQVARNAAVAGQRVLYFSFEHDAELLLERLLCIEAAALHGPEGLTADNVRAVMRQVGGSSGLAERLRGVEGGAEAVAALEKWAERLAVHRGDGSATTLETIRESVRQFAGERAPLVIVDYLQKVAAPDPLAAEDERATLIVEGLKDLALGTETAVLAVVAADKEGIVSGRRLQIHHLRGSSALAYEPDVVLLLNEKYDVVARHHLVYDVAGAERFHDWVVVSVEKNRSGLAQVDLEFRKLFAQSCFDPGGRKVAERLVDERVFTQ
jgi:replicative DNA helicase